MAAMAVAMEKSVLLFSFHWLNAGNQVKQFHGSIHE